MMSNASTIYGDLSGVEFRTIYSNGKTDGCLVTEANTLTTSYGTLVPQYEAEDMGRRAVKPMDHYYETPWKRKHRSPRAAGFWWV